MAAPVLSQAQAGDLGARKDRSQEFGHFGDGPQVAVQPSRQIEGALCSSTLPAFLPASESGKLSGMGNPAIDTVMDSLLDPLARCFDADSARRVSELRIDPALQSRIDLLAERANEGVLSEEERAEYEASVNVSDLIAILRLKARRQLDSGQS